MRFKLSLVTLSLSSFRAYHEFALSFEVLQLSLFNLKMTLQVSPKFFRVHIGIAKLICYNACAIMFQAS